MVARPEVSRFVALYDAASKAKDATQLLDNRHLEQTERSQRAFLDKVDNLFKMVKNKGQNPLPRIHEGTTKWTGIHLL